MTRLNYDYPEDEHVEWSVAARRKGVTLKEWARRALNRVAEEEAAGRAEAERKHRKG